MKPLPVSTQDFATLIQNNQLYVDKTQLIHKLITEGRFYFLSRPRRFGKSLLVTTIKEIFCGRKELFKDLWIENNWNWKENFPVIHLPFASLDYQTDGLEQSIIDLLNTLNAQNNWGIEIDQNSCKKALGQLIVGLSTKLNRKVVVLIDEYDKPIIDYIGSDLDTAKENQQIMKKFYSVVKDLDAHIRFFFLTGVSKFSKVSVFSDLNNLFDITLDERYASLLGITQDELEKDLSDYINLLATKQNTSRNKVLTQIQEWYNGYNWHGEESVYNPYSTINLFASLQFKNYWFNSATPSFLIDLLRDQELYNVDNVVVGPSVFESFEINKQINIKSLLFQTGYLTIKNISKRGLYTLSYPNKEVRESFLDYLVECFSRTSKEDVKPIVL